MIQIDMEMPETCNDCPCSYFTEGMSSYYCQVNNRDFDKETEGKTYLGTPNGIYTRQKWCPLKESEEKTESEWISKDISDLVYCSKCDFREWYIYAADYNYCPNCGRKMKKEGKE